MTVRKLLRIVSVLFIVFMFIYALESEVGARIGGSRSFGSRGSRSFSTPSSPSTMPSSPSRQYNTTPSGPTNSPYQQPQSGGLLRGMAGGLLGGIMGGMLFRSLGFGGMGGMGGGFGLFDFILIGAILYGIWWFISKKKRDAIASNPAYYQDQSFADQRQASFTSFPAGAAAVTQDVETGLGHIQRMDGAFDEKKFRDQCMDTFFTIQGAWANRDISTVRLLLTDEMYGIIHGDIEDLKKNGKVNHLENIAVRSVDITEAWQEGGNDFITVRFYANLLDYTVDETSGQVVSGSKTNPVKFEEYWTFIRPVGNNSWRLSAISQAQ